MRRICKAGSGNECVLRRKTEWNDRRMSGTNGQNRLIMIITKNNRYEDDEK